MNRHWRDLDTGRPYDGITTTTAEIRRAAMHQILANANDPSDAKLLLDMLGIDPYGVSV